MKVTFMGTGTSVGVPAIGCHCGTCTSTDARNRRLRSSVLLRHGEARILIDASFDLRQQALREKLDTLDAVLLTHGHADHVFGLDDVRMYNYHQRRPVPIYASARTASQVKRTFWYVFQESTDASSRPSLALTTVEGPFDLHGLVVRPFPVIHGEAIITGYRIGSFAYITDGKSIPAESFALLEGLDLLVINTLRRAPHPTHFTLEETLAAIRAIAPRRALLTHMSHDLEHASLAAELPPAIQPAYDGLTVEVDAGEPATGGLSGRPQ